GFFLLILCLSTEKTNHDQSIKILESRQVACASLNSWLSHEMCTFNGGSFHLGLCCFAHYDLVRRFYPYRLFVTQNQIHLCFLSSVKVLLFRSEEHTSELQSRF